MPPDREGSFEPELVRKQPRCVGEFNERILQVLYGRGMSTRDPGRLLEAYGAKVSSTLVSRVTNAVLEDIEDWPVTETGLGPIPWSAGTAV